LSGKFALTYTVKNESRLLPSGIEYHLAAGCSRIYVFWDNTTDNAPELVARYPQVIARKSFRPEELENPPAWLARILPSWDDDLDVRKIANSYYAALEGAKEGIEWIINVDADELILMNRDEQTLENHIPRYLEKIPQNIDQVLALNLESIPTAADTRNPFTDCVYFLNRFRASEFVWRYSRAALIRISRSPKLIAWYDWLFYQVLFAGAMQRMMRDPETHEPIPGGYFLAYVSYKSFMRAARATDFNFATHGWKPYLKKPRSLRTGNVLHFDLLDAAYFAAKFRQRPPERGLFHFRTQLSVVARDRSMEQVRQFFEDYIAIRDPRRIERLKKKGIVVEIRTVSNLLKKLTQMRVNARD
jgi:Glycosyl transferase family 2